MSTLPCATPVQYERSDEQEQFLKRMTFQVCLIGRNGFVLASDTRVVKMLPREINQQFSTTKIFFNQPVCAAWCSAGNDLTRQFCEELEKLLAQDADGAPSSDREFCEYFQKAAEQVRRQTSFEEQMFGAGKVLFVCAPPNRARGWCLNFGFLQTQQKWDIHRVMPFTDKHTIGAEGNAAIFFPERYYGPDRPLAELVGIAAHTILMAGAIDPSAVDGLEVVKCQDGGLRMFPESELALLRRESKHIDDQIAKGFTEWR